MYPDSPGLYTHEVKTVDAVFQREKGSVVLQSPLDKVCDNTLKICYRKYKAKGNGSPRSKTKLNLVFFHGTGMNKGLWHYHIDKLFKFFNSEDNGTKLHLNVVCAFDAVNHGDSAYLNKEKLGYVSDWRDNSKDVIKVLTEDETATFVEAENKITVMIGHSMGGFVTLYSAFLAPFLFDSCILVNPVCYVHSSEFTDKDIEFKKWHDKGYMKDEFDIAADRDWKKELEKYFKNESFLRDFHPIVLRNMLEDELPHEIKQTPHKSYNKITLHTTVTNQLRTYWGMNKSVPFGMPVYDKIRIPIFHVVADGDIASAAGRSFVRSSLKDVVHAIDIPNAKHLINGQDPDSVTKLFTLILQERELVHARSSVIDEDYLVKNYGKNYRQVLSDARLKSVTKFGARIPKL